MKESGERTKKPGLFPRLLALLVTAALVLGALALVAYRDRLNLDAVRRYFAYRSLELNQTGQAAPFAHAGGNRMSFALLDSGVAMASQTGAHYYSFQGKAYAETVEALEDPVLTRCGQTAAAYDAGAQSLFVYRRGEEAFSLHLEENDQLLSARLNSSGWLAVTAQQSGYKGAVTVYDENYDPVIQISLSSTFVADAAVSPDCGTVAVVTIGQERGVFQSSLLYYHMNEKEPYAQVSLGDMVVLDLEYEEGCIWVLGEDQMITLSGETHERNTWAFGQYYLKGCTLGGDGFATLLLGRYRAAPASLLVVLGPDGSQIGQRPLQGQTLDLDANGRYLALLSSEGLSVYTWELEVYSTLSNPRGARQVSVGQDSTVLLVGNEEAWLYLPS